MMGVFVAFLQVFLPLQVQAFAPDQKVSTLGLVMGIGGLCAALTNPIAGTLSDHSGSRFGRRTPWLLGSALVSLCARRRLDHRFAPYRSDRHRLCPR